MFKKILVAIAAIAMPMGTATAVGVVGSGVAGAAASPPSTTITCALAGSATFQKPGISAAGALTSATVVKTKTAVTPTGTGCSGTAMKLNIPSVTTACPQTGGVPDPGDVAACLASKTKNNVTTYAIATKPFYYGTTSSYATSGLTDLIAAYQAKPFKTVVDNVKVVLSYGAASQVLPGGACGATDAGFDLTGNATVKGLPVATYEALACISGDTGTGVTGNFVNDLLSPTALIQSLVIGGSSSLTVTFPNEQCAVTGSVAFAKPGLSAGGALTSATSVTTKSVTTASGTLCPNAASTLVIHSATTACPQTGGVPDPGDVSACLASKTKNNVTTYAIATKPFYYDTTASYATSGLTDLTAALQAKPPKAVVDNLKLVMAYGSATEILPGGACGATNPGFDISGDATIKGLKVGTYEEVACVTGDTGTGVSGNFVNDLLSPTALITGLTIGGDANSNLTVIFGP